MNEIMQHDRDDDELERGYRSRADRFALVLVIGLSFVCLNVAQFLIHNTIVSIMFGGICLAGMISWELYVIWISGQFPRRPRHRSVGRAWRSIAVRSGFIAAASLISGAADGRLSGATAVFAIAAGVAAGIVFWWQEIRSPAGKGSI